MTISSDSQLKTISDRKAQNLPSESDEGGNAEIEGVEDMHDHVGGVYASPLVMLVCSYARMLVCCYPGVELGNWELGNGHWSLLGQGRNATRTSDRPLVNCSIFNTYANQAGLASSRARAARREGCLPNR